jgi:hypothetical protein
MPDAGRSEALAAKERRQDSAPAHIDTLPEPVRDFRQCGPLTPCRHAEHDVVLAQHPADPGCRHDGFRRRGLPIWRKNGAARQSDQSRGAFAFP